MIQPRIALLGCGRWGKHILRDLKELGTNVCVIANSVESRENAKNGNADEIFPDIRSIAHPIDAAIIATPSTIHYKGIMDVVDKFGKIPIYVEKPMCTTIEEAEILLKSHSDHVFVMHKWRFHNGILKLGELVQSGELGKLKGIKLIRNGWGNPHKDVDCTWVLLPHDLSIIIEIIGYIPPINNSIIDFADNRISGLIAILSNEKHWASIEISDRSPEHRRETIVYFENGIGRLTDSYDDHIEVFKTQNQHLNNKVETEKIYFENNLPLHQELHSFIEYVKGERYAPKSSVKDAFEVVKTICSLLKIGLKNAGAS
jgi:predicted dehydrogenase